MVRVSKKPRPPRRPITFEDAWKKIEDVGNTIINNKSLRHDKDERAVALAVASLSHIPNSEKGRRFRSFLTSVQARCRPNSATGVLLCCTAIGKDNITNMNILRRTALYNKLESERNGPLLSSPILKQIPSSSQIPIMTGEANQPTLPAHSSPSSIDVATFEHASLEGIATVFNEDLCGFISNVSTQNDGETVWKAAVTTTFPLWGGLVNCLMSLDVSLVGVDYFAMALFNARINPAEPLRHITFDNGPTLILPNSELTMKGVKDETIEKFFGTEVYEAIRDSHVRRMEVEQAKPLTECVSMIVTRHGAIVNLSLDLNRGIEISGKLYS